MTAALEEALRPAVDACLARLEAAIAERAAVKEYFVPALEVWAQYCFREGDTSDYKQDSDDGDFWTLILHGFDHETQDRRTIKTPRGGSPSPDQFGDMLESARARAPAALAACWMDATASMLAAGVQRSALRDAVDEVVVRSVMET